MIDYSKDYYRILLIDRNASDKEIKDAYYFLVKKFHPDNNIQESEHNKHFAEERFKEIEEAYKILSNPSSKSDYDANFGYNNSSSNKNYEYSNENSYYEYESSARKSAREAAYSWNIYSEKDHNEMGEMDDYNNSTNINKSSTNHEYPLFSRIIFGFIMLMMGLIAVKSCSNSSNNQVKYTNTNIKQGWLNENDGLHLYINNERVKNKWEKFNGAWVHLNPAGNLDKNSWIEGYYVNFDGIMVTNGWADQGINRYYLGNDGKPCCNQFLDYGGKTYYLDENGKVVINSWINFNGKWYRTDFDGKIMKNVHFYDSNKKKYIIDKNGVVINYP